MVVKPLITIDFTIKWHLRSKVQGHWQAYRPILLYFDAFLPQNPYK